MALTDEQRQQFQQFMANKTSVNTTAEPIIATPEPQIKTAEPIGKPEALQQDVIQNTPQSIQPEQQIDPNAQMMKMKTASTVLEQKGVPQDKGFFERFILGSRPGGLLEKQSQNIEASLERQKKGETGFLAGGLQRTGEVFSGITNTASEALMAIPGVKQALGGAIGAGNVLGEKLDLKPYLPESTQQKIGNAQIEFDAASEVISEYLDKNPNAKANLKAPFQILEAALDFVGLGEAGTLGRALTKETVETAIDAKRIANTAVKTAEEAKQTAKIIPEVRKPAVADKLSNSLNKIDPVRGQQDFMKISNGQTAGEWLNDRGFTGTRTENVQNLVDYWKNSKKKVDKALSIPTQKFKSTEFGEAIDALTEELGKRSTDRPRFEQLQKAYNDGGLTLKQENELKRIYERNVALAHKKDITKTAKAKRDATDLDNALREGLIDRAETLGIKDIRALNKETQGAKFLADAISGKQAKQAANNTLSLTDNISLVGATVNPQFLALYGLKKLAGLEKSQSLLIKALRKGDVKPMIEPDFNKIKALNLKREAQINKGRGLNPEFNRSEQKTLNQTQDTGALQGETQVPVSQAPKASKSTLIEPSASTIPEAKKNTSLNKTTTSGKMEGMDKLKADLEKIIKEADQDTPSGRGIIMRAEREIKKINEGGDTKNIQKFIDDTLKPKAATKLDNVGLDEIERAVFSKLGEARFFNSRFDASSFIRNEYPGGIDGLLKDISKK